MCNLRCLRLDEEAADVSPIILHRNLLRQTIASDDEQPIGHSMFFGSKGWATSLASARVAGERQSWANMLLERIHTREQEIAELQQGNTDIKKRLNEVKKKFLQQRRNHETEVRALDFLINQLSQEKLLMQKRIETIEHALDDTPDSSDGAEEPPTAIQERALSSDLQELLESEDTFPSEKAKSEEEETSDTVEEQLPPETHVRVLQSKLSKAVRIIRAMQKQMNLVLGAKNKVIEDCTREAETLRTAREQWEMEYLYHLATEEEAGPAKAEGQASSTVTPSRERSQPDERSLSPIEENLGEDESYVDSREEMEVEWYHAVDRPHSEATEGEHVKHLSTKEQEEEVSLPRKNDEEGNISVGTEDTEVLEQLVNEIATVSREIEKDLKSAKR